MQGPAGPAGPGRPLTRHLHACGDRHQAGLAIGSTIDRDQAVKADAHPAEVASRGLVFGCRPQHRLSHGPKRRRDTLPGPTQHLPAVELELHHLGSKLAG